MAEWRRAYKALSPVRQMMVATIIWLYRGEPDKTWLSRLPSTWHAADAIAGQGRRHSPRCVLAAASQSASYCSALSQRCFLRHARLLRPRWRRPSAAHIAAINSLRRNGF